MAIFASSPVYAGRDTGFASYRARQWRLCDRRSTGVLGLEDWRRHLTTPFPEVRPQGFLEVRGIDALPPAGTPRRSSSWPVRER